MWRICWTKSYKLASWIVVTMVTRGRRLLSLPLGKRGKAERSEEVWPVTHAVDRAACWVLAIWRPPWCADERSFTVAWNQRTKLPKPNKPTLPVFSAALCSLSLKTRSQTGESHRAGGQDRPGRADPVLRSRLRASTMGRSWLWLQQLLQVRDPQGWEWLQETQGALNLIPSAEDLSPVGEPAPRAGGLPVLWSAETLEAESRVIVRPGVSHAFDSSARSPSGNWRPQKQPVAWELGACVCLCGASWFPHFPPPPTSRAELEESQTFCLSEGLSTLSTHFFFYLPLFCFLFHPFWYTLVFKAGGSRAFAAQDSPTPSPAHGVRDAAVASLGTRGGRWSWPYRLEPAFGFYEKEALWENRRLQILSSELEDEGSGKWIAPAPLGLE